MDDLLLAFSDVQKVCFGPEAAIRTSMECLLWVCRLNRSPQHFILEGKDGVWDGTKIS